MHYGDKKQIAKAILKCVIYKHEICGTDIKRNKNGLTSKRSIDYELASIQDCKYFNPRLLSNILQDPYKYFVKELDKFDNEEWLMITVRNTDGWHKYHIESVENVSSFYDFRKLH